MCAAFFPTSAAPVSCYWWKLKQNIASNVNFHLSSISTKSCSLPNSTLQARARPYSFFLRPLKPPWTLFQLDTTCSQISVCESLSNWLSCIMSCIVFSWADKLYICEEMLWLSTEWKAAMINQEISIYSKWYCEFPAMVAPIPCCYQSNGQAYRSKIKIKNISISEI